MVIQVVPVLVINKSPNSERSDRKLRCGFLACVCVSVCVWLYGWGVFKGWAEIELERSLH